MSRQRTPKQSEISSAVRIATDTHEQHLVLSATERDLILAFRKTRDRQQREMAKFLNIIAEKFPRTHEPVLRLVVGGAA